MQRDTSSEELLSSADQIDDLCDSFESAWRAGARPDIGALLDRVEKSQRDSLFYELMLVELEFRRTGGERAWRDEYLGRFPQYAEIVEAIDFKHRSNAFATTHAGITETVRILIHKVGNRIGHFELVERLGAGAMGEVWKAWDTRLQRPVAIKLPRADHLSEVDLHRFMREGQAAAQLRHPRLASVHEVGRDGDTVYIVADYVEGSSLRQFLTTSEGLSFTAMAELCAEVAEALHHAHEQGVVHRDLKPANIIVDRAGRPHVIDFGLAKWASDARELTVQGELLGTPAYMAPEQARGDTESVDRRTDVYALGVILYEMLTGRCPFIGDQASVIHAIASREPAAPRAIAGNIPRDLETICLRALAKDAPRRYPSTQEMAVDLRRFVRGEPILARRVGRVEQGWRWLRKHPAVAASILLTLVAGGAITAAGVFAERNRELLGLQTVTITTEPAGARVAFAPISAAGELLADQVIKASGVTPVRVDLTSGDYFVEVVSPDGRFHQVFRHVPQPGKSFRLNWSSHRDWIAEDDGSFRLAAIKIPPLEVTNGMDLISYRTWAANSADERSFYCDSEDFTVEQWRKLKLGNISASLLPPSERLKNGMKPLKAKFDSAANLAERAGKRLPTSLEYDYLVRVSTPGSDIEDPKTLQPGREVFRRHLISMSFRCVRSSRPRFIMDESPVIPGGR